MAAACALLVLAGCQAPPSRVDAAAPSATTLADAPARCAALLETRATGLRVTQAEWIAAGTQRVIEPHTGEAVGEALPAHCRVRGRLDERVGVDRERYHIGFELRLPQAFTGRMLVQGGEGLGGTLPMAVGRNTGAHGWERHALGRGFAAASTDEGHQQSSPLFGLDRQARIDQTWRAHERTTQVARQLVERFYGQPPQRSYFVGCGSGGRQGMLFAQRRPELFDGIVAVAPAMRASLGATIAAAWTVQSLAAVAPRGADGQRLLAQALTDAQLQRVGREIVDRCDAADGLVDGLVSDTALCRIDVQRLTCPDAGEGCLRAEQAQALRRAMDGPRNRAGTPLYFRWPWDPGIAHPGWRAWNLGTAAAGAPDARHVTDTSGALGFVYATPADPTLTTLGFDFDRDPLRLQATHALHDSADDVQLRGFVARGGRLLLLHGMADPVASAFETVDYQERLNRAHGAVAASRFARSFLVPGMNHCAGGPSTDDFDGLAAIVDWVEGGRAPERIVARGSQIRPGITRPLCPYPRIARYRGQGDPAAAESFDCR